MNYYLNPVFPATFIVDPEQSLADRICLIMLI